MSTEPEAVELAPNGTPSFTLSPEMMAFIAELQKGNLQMVAEMKKPDAETQAKIDAEKARSMQLTMARVEAARKEEAGRAARQASCSHTKPNGKTNLRGQVNSNNFAQAYCSYCGYLSKPFEASNHEIMSGLNLDGWGANAHAIVEQRARNSGTPPPIPDIPVGATILF